MSNSTIIITTTQSKFICYYFYWNPIIVNPYVAYLQFIKQIIYYNYYYYIVKHYYYFMKEIWEYAKTHLIQESNL